MFSNHKNKARQKSMNNRNMTVSPLMRDVCRSAGGSIQSTPFTIYRKEAP
jgi:hypothetical protein